VEAIQKRDRWLQFYQERELSVRKSYGYSPPGEEDHDEARGPGSPAPDASRSLARALAQVPFRWLVKQAVRIFIIKSRWMLKRALAPRS
jgi:hypothetical protein